MKAYRIKIVEKISDIIVTRQTIKSLFQNKKFVNYDKIIFDFSKVTFISRTAADQLYKENKKSKYNIEIINLSSNVTKMLKVVEQTQNGSPRQLYEVPIIKFKNKTTLSNFLSTI